MTIYLNFSVTFAHLLNLNSFLKNSLLSHELHVVIGAAKNMMILKALSSIIVSNLNRKICWNLNSQYTKLHFFLNHEVTWQVLHEDFLAYSSKDNALMSNFKIESLIFCLKMHC